MINLGGEDIGNNINIGISGLIGHWLTGDAKDKTPFQHDGVVTNATKTIDRFNQTDEAYLFDGTSYITIPNFDYDLTNGCSVSCWVSFTTFADEGGSNQRILAYQVSLGNYIQLILNVNGPCLMTKKGGVQLTTYKSAPLDLNKFYHVCTTYDYTTEVINTYIDAELDNYVAVTGAFNSPDNGLRLGARTITSGRMSGKLHDMRFFNRVVNQSEIDLLYKTSNSNLKLTGE